MEEQLRLVAGVRATLAAELATSWPLGSLRRATASQLLEAGCTAGQAKRIVAAFALAREVRALSSRDVRPRFRMPRDIVAHARSALDGWQQEHMLVLQLDARQRLVTSQVVATGTLNGVEVHPREVYRDAVRMAAHSIAVAHNHPSGDPEPSQADHQLTERLKRAGQVIGIPLLDHLIVADDGYYSFAEHGHMLSTT